MHTARLQSIQNSVCSLHRTALTNLLLRKEPGRLRSLPAVDVPALHTRTFSVKHCDYLLQQVLIQSRCCDHGWSGRKNSRGKMLKHRSTFFMPLSKTAVSLTNIYHGSFSNFTIYADFLSKPWQTKRCVRVVMLLAQICLRSLGALEFATCAYGTQYLKCIAEQQAFIEPATRSFGV